MAPDFDPIVRIIALIDGESLRVVARMTLVYRPDEVMKLTVIEADGDQRRALLS